MVGFFQDTGGGIVGGGGGGRPVGLCQYQRLECCCRDDDGAAAAPRPRWRWLPAPSSPCFFHVKKLRWSRITSAFLPRKVAELSAKIRRQAASGGATGAGGVCPTVVIFMTPWGLPVLSRPLLAGDRGRYQHHHGRESF